MRGSRTSSGARSPVGVVRSATCWVPRHRARCVLRRSSRVVPPSPASRTAFARRPLPLVALLLSGEVETSCIGALVAWRLSGEAESFGHSPASEAMRGSRTSSGARSPVGVVRSATCWVPRHRARCDLRRSSRVVPPSPASRTAFARRPLPLVALLLSGEVETSGIGALVAALLAGEAESFGHSPASEAMRGRRAAPTATHPVRYLGLLVECRRTEPIQSCATNGCSSSSAAPRARLPATESRGCSRRRPRRGFPSARSP